MHVLCSTVQLPTRNITIPQVSKAPTCHARRRLLRPLRLCLVDGRGPLRRLQGCCPAGSFQVCHLCAGPAQGQLSFLSLRILNTELVWSPSEGFAQEDNLHADTILLSKKKLGARGGRYMTGYAF